MHGAGAGHRHPILMLNPEARHDRICQARPHLPEGIPPPALSGRLLRREQELGVPLVSRRRFALPAAGQRLFRHARDGIEPLDARVEKLRPSPLPRTHAVGRGGVDRAERPDYRGGIRILGGFSHLAPSPALNPATITGAPHLTAIPGAIKSTQRRGPA